MISSVGSGCEFIPAEWPAPPGIHAFTTTRIGGVSAGPWASMNLGAHCGDRSAHVAANRQRLVKHLPGPVDWLNQVHGTGVHHRVSDTSTGSTADAQWTTDLNRVCAVLTADCLPVVFCSQCSSVVAVAHAGWRGLADGVLEATVSALPDLPLMAWLGPAIGPKVYEVGDDVVECFPGDREPGFKPHGRRWLMDIYALARLRLERAGVQSVHGGTHCTYSEPERFYSWRRDGETGRMATVIWRTQ